MGALDQFDFLPDLAWYMIIVAIITVVVFYTRPPEKRRAVRTREFYKENFGISLVAYTVLIAMLFILSAANTKSVENLRDYFRFYNIDTSFVDRIVAPEETDLFTATIGYTFVFVVGSLGFFLVIAFFIQLAARIALGIEWGLVDIYHISLWTFLLFTLVTTLGITNVFAMAGTAVLLYYGLAESQ